MKDFLDKVAGRAARPVDVSLSNAVARSVLATPFCGLDEGLKRVLALAPATRVEA